MGEERLAAGVARLKEQCGVGLRPDAADPDHLEHLANEITTLSAHIHAATHRLLTLLAEFEGG